MTARRVRVVVLRPTMKPQNRIRGPGAADGGRNALVGGDHLDLIRQIDAFGYVTQSVVVGDDDRPVLGEGGNPEESDIADANVESCPDPLGEHRWIGAGRTRRSAPAVAAAAAMASRWARAAETGTGAGAPRVPAPAAAAAGATLGPTGPAGATGAAGGGVAGGPSWTGGTGGAPGPGAGATGAAVPSDGPEAEGV